MSSMGSRLSFRDFKIVKITRQGNCMFEAAWVATLIADRMPLPPSTENNPEIREYGKILRNQVVEHICEHGNSNIMIADPLTGRNFPGSLSRWNRRTAYCTSMKKMGCFGGELELMALAQVLGRDVSVYRLQPTTGYTLVSTYRANTQAKGNPIMLVFRLLTDQRNMYNRETGHYDALRPASSRNSSRNSSRTRANAGLDMNLQRALAESLKNSNESRYQAELAQALAMSRNEAARANRQYEADLARAFAENAKMWRQRRANTRTNTRTGTILNLDLGRSIVAQSLKNFKNWWQGGRRR